MAIWYVDCENLIPDFDLQLLAQIRSYLTELK